MWFGRSSSGSTVSSLDLIAKHRHINLFISSLFWYDQRFAPQVWHTIHSTASSPTSTPSLLTLCLHIACLFECWLEFRSALALAPCLFYHWPLCAWTRTVCARQYFCARRAGPFYLLHFWLGLLELTIFVRLYCQIYVSVLCDVLFFGATLLGLCALALERVTLSIDCCFFAFHGGSFFAWKGFCAFGGWLQFPH